MLRQTICSVKIFAFVFAFAVWLNCTSAIAANDAPDEFKQAADEIAQQMRHPEVAANEAFSSHLFPYEPIYFLYSSDPVANITFQLSFAVRLIPTIKTKNRLDGIYFAYTQRSFWDLDGYSAPFYDSSYMPELAYRFEGFNNNPPLGIEYQHYQLGYKHESNGKDGTESRSMDTAYVEGSWLWGLGGDWHFHLRPRIWTYLEKEFYNDDIEEYRGNIRIDASVGSRNGIYLATRSHIGSEFDKGSLQLDVTYPLNELIKVPLYFHVQYFNGYAETLRTYDEQSDRFLVGIAVTR